MRNWRSVRLELEVEVEEMSGTADTADMCSLADCRGWTAECGGSERGGGRVELRAMLCNTGAGATCCHQHRSPGAGWRTQHS